MSPGVLVDTSAWIALTVSRDQDHRSCKRIYEAIKKSGEAIITTDAVLSETLTRLRYDSGFRASERFYQGIQSAVSRFALRVVWSTPADFQEAWKIMRKFHDHAFSFVDCLTAAHARCLRVQHIFTLDNDFAIMGFIIETLTWEV